MADHTTEKFLNLLMVFSSAMALLLVYDRMDSMLTPYTALEPTVSVSELSQKCSSIWKGHRQNATQQNGKHVDRWFSNHHTKPKYSSGNGFCERLPAHLSAPHLWNEHLHWILEASSNVKDISSHLLTSKLLQFLTPSKYLELGHRSRPSHQAWGRLLDKIHKRMKDSTAPVVHIAAFGAGSMDCNLNEPGEELSADERRKDMDCLWPIRLEAFLNTILNHDGAGGKGKRAIVNITPLYTPKDGIMVTTELDTAVVRNQLWVDYIQKNGGPDVIISAFNAQDMYLPRRDMDTANGIDYYHHQRTILQDFYRTCLELKPCQANAQKQDPPLLLAVDDYVGNQHGPVMAETVQARVLQLLSDYYETGFVSYAEVIRKLVYASNHNHSPLIHTSLKEWASDWHSLGASDNSNSVEMMEHGFLGPIAMTLTLAYSFLRYTVSFCEEQQQAADYAMVKEDVFQLVQDVIPPTLDTDLCLNNVTELWAVEKTKQEERNQACLANPGTGMYNCAFDFWGGTHDTSEMLEEYLQNFMNHGDVPEGWQTAHGGRLLAMQAGATLALQMKPLPGRTHWKLQVFSVYKDVAAESEPAVLQWTVSPTGQRRHRRLIPHHKHNNNYTIAEEHQSRRSLQEHSQTTTGRINGTHDSPSTVVLPTILPIDERLLTSEFNEFELKLELIEGNSFEIVAIMFCSEDQYNI